MPYSRHFAQRRQYTINWHIPSEDPPDRFKARSTRFLRILRAFCTRRSSRRFIHQFVDRSLELPVRHMSAKASFRGAPGRANSIAIRKSRRKKPLMRGCPSTWRAPRPSRGPSTIRRNRGSCPFWTGFAICSAHFQNIQTCFSVDIPGGQAPARSSVKNILSKSKAR